jgi:Ribbon-helix-helix protein, copG family
LAVTIGDQGCPALGNEDRPSSVVSKVPSGGSCSTRRLRVGKTRIPDEVRWMEIGPALRKGRPRKGVTSSGKTPLTSVPLPDEIRAELARRAKAEGSSASELIRQAIIEYFGHHPA